AATTVRRHEPASWLGRHVQSNGGLLAAAYGIGKERRQLAWHARSARDGKWSAHARCVLGSRAHALMRGPPHVHRRGDPMCNHYTRRRNRRVRTVNGGNDSRITSPFGDAATFRASYRITSGRRASTLLRAPAVALPAAEEPGRDRDTEQRARRHAAHAP